MLPPKPSKASNNNKKPPSFIWNHFTPLDPERKKSSGNYYQIVYSTYSKKNESSNCKKHLEVSPRIKRENDA